MPARSNIRRLAGATALVAAAGGLGACTLTGPTATLHGTTVVVAGTDVDDQISIASDATQLTVDFDSDGTVDAAFARADFDQVLVSAGSGDDGVQVTGAGDVPMTISGGDGSDGIGVVGHIGRTGATDAPITVSGDDGNDRIFAATPGPVTLEGGAGDDRIEGGGAGIGQERVSLGDGNDHFTSSLNAFIGARSDVVDGGIGQDVMEMDGSFASESLTLSGNAGHLVVDHELRDHIDAVGVEDVRYLGFGGEDEGSGDAVAVNDLSGTGVVRFTPNFGSSAEATTSDNSADTLTVRGTSKVDHITVSGSGKDTVVSGLSPTVSPIFLQPDDVLRIDTLDGDDVVDSSGLQAGLVQLQVL